MVLNHKMSQTVKIKVNRYTHIYLLMNLFKINQFIFIAVYIDSLVMISIERSEKNQKRALKVRDKFKKFFTISPSNMTF